MKEEWLDYYKYLHKLSSSGSQSIPKLAFELSREYSLDYNTSMTIIHNYIKNYSEIKERIKNAQ